MKLIRKDKLIKLKRKNLGNAALIKDIDTLIKDIEGGKWKNKQDLIKDRPDADCVHNDGFYFFDINIHRTMVLVDFAIEDEEDENGEEADEDDNIGGAEILWVGTHDEYELRFKNNKSTIEKWLRSQGRIQ